MGPFVGNPVLYAGRHGLWNLLGGDIPKCTGLLTSGPFNLRRGKRPINGETGPVLAQYPVIGKRLNGNVEGVAPGV